VAAELDALALGPTIEPGGVGWTGTLESVALANLWLRTASRVIVRIASFRARTFHELERHARRLAWERFVAARAPLRFRVTTRKSRLYHSDAIVERHMEAAAARSGAAPVASPRGHRAGPGTRRAAHLLDHAHATAD
jgi:putative N6-adenine-specific DNA methylase